MTSRNNRYIVIAGVSIFVISILFSSYYDWASLFLKGWILMPCRFMYRFWALYFMNIKMHQGYTEHLPICHEFGTISNMLGKHTVILRHDKVQEIDNRYKIVSTSYDVVPIGAGVFLLIRYVLVMLWSTKSGVFLSCNGCIIYEKYFLHNHDSYLGIKYSVL